MSDNNGKFLAFVVGAIAMLVTLVVVAEATAPTCETLHPQVVVFAGHAVVIPPSTTVEWCHGARLLRFRDRFDGQQVAPPDGTSAE